jgi:hypothetical protein
MTRPTTWARGVLLAVVVGAVGVTTAITVRHRQPTLDRAALRLEDDGWTIRGMRRSHYEGGTRVLTVAVDRARLEHIRLGPIGLGFARRVVAHDASIDLVIDAETDDPRASFSRALESLALEHRREAVRLAGARFEGIRRRATRASTGGWMEIAADRGESGMLDRERIRFVGNVRVRDADTEIAFDHLTYDARHMRFLSGKDGRVVTTPGSASPVAAIDLVNRVVADFIQNPGSPIL